MTYAIGHVLGEGGFGVVHQVVIGDHCLPLVAKKMKKITSSAIREIVFTQSLSHPNIIPLQKIIIHDDHLYAIYPKGTPLLDYLIRNNPSVREKQKIFDQIVTGVLYLHQNGIIHCDVSVENIIMIDSVPVLTDLGSAFLSQYPNTRLIEAKQEYKIPEWKIKTVSSCDYWSLGVLLYFIMTGNYLNSSTKELVISQLHDLIVPIETMNIMKFYLFHTDEQYVIKQPISEIFPSSASAAFFSSVCKNLDHSNNPISINSLIASRSLTRIDSQICETLLWISRALYTGDQIFLTTSLNTLHLVLNESWGHLCNLRTEILNRISIHAINIGIDCFVPLGIPSSTLTNFHRDDLKKWFCYLKHTNKMTDDVREILKY